MTGIQKARALLSSLPFAFCLLPSLVFAAVPEGYVVKVESPTVYLDWGKSSGVQVGDSFAVYRFGEPLKHPVTGEILGKTEETIAQGVLEQVQEKFSIGRLVELHGVLRSGDRTRYLEVKSSSSAVAPAVGLTPVSQAHSAPLRERWRSEALPDEAVGMTLADVDGDGQKEIAVAFSNKIMVFRWAAGHLEPLATYQDRHFRHWLAIEAADLNHQGRDDLYATAFLDGLNRARVVVLHFENNSLKSVANVEGFVRSVEHMGGSRQLLWQNMSRARDMHFTSPSEFLMEKNAYKTGTAIKLPRNYYEQLFGFSFGDWDGDGAEDMAILVNGDRLRVHFKGMKWTSPDAYGGTKNDFSYGEQQTSLQPRLLSWQPAGGKPQLLVPHNFSELGIRLTYLKLFKKSEIIGFTWNGLEMAPAWTLPVAGYLADFAVGDGLRESTPQLWAATVGPGDKTVLLAYSLP